MAVTTKKTFPATSNATTTVFSPVGIQLNNQDDLDVYVTLSGGTRVLQLRQATASTAQSSHPQVNNTDGLYFPAVSAGTNLINYTLSSDNNTITFNSALPSGAVVFCERRTRDASGTYTTFASGSTIRATDLNNSSTESNFTAQDARNKAFTIEGVLFRGDQPSTRFITADHIVNGTIVNQSIANDSVNADKIADDVINSEHYVAGSIDHEHLANDIIDGDNIQDDVINSEHYVAGSIDHEHLANDIIDGDNIQDDVINSEHYVAGSIDHEHLSNDCVDGDNIQNDSINSEHYVDGSIDHVHLSNDCVDEDNIQDDAVRAEHIQANAVTDSEIATGTLDNRYFTETELNPSANAGQNVLDARYFTETELTNGALDGRYFTETEAEAAFLRQDSSETIASGVTWSSTDDKVATTAAIDLRVIELVDDVGGFVPIANETSFPTENPDINTSGTAKGGTIVSVAAASTNLIPNGTTVTIANGRGTGNAVIITDVPTTIPQGFGFLVETTATDHTYSFHRLVPKATEVTTVAANAVNIAAAGANVTSIDNFADRYQISNNAPTARPDSSNLALGDLWFDSSSNKVMMVYDASAGDGFSPITPNQATLTNINIVAGHVTFQEDLGNITDAINTGSGNNSVNTVGSNIANVNTAATNIAKITTVADDLNESTSEIDTVATNIANVNTVGNAITNVNNVGNSIGNVNTVHGSLANVNTAATNIASINTAASNISNVNNFTDLYQIDSSDPAQDGGGNNLAQGDLYFNTTSNELRVYNGGSWQGGVTATGNLAGLGANTFTGNQSHGDNVKNTFGTGNDLEIFHTGSQSTIQSSNVNNFTIRQKDSNGFLFIHGDQLNLRSQTDNDLYFSAVNGGTAKIYFDNSEKLQTTSTGVTVTGLMTATTIDGAAGNNLQLDFGTL